MIETLQVEARGDLLIVTESNTEFIAIYVKPELQPQRMLMRCSPTNDRILQSQARQAANNKARELGWIGGSASVGILAFMAESCSAATVTARRSR